tara:strand:- start:886 stop:1527 length:642 start_codon:yes stop_codon:yes gene_type:complete
MKSFDEYSLSYDEAIRLIDLNDFDGAIKYIKKNIVSLSEPDELALAYLNCGFLSEKLGDHLSAIDDFSKSICFESELKSINQRSKDISFSARSDSRYKDGNYQGAIEDKRKAKKIRLLELERLPKENSIKIDYKNILLGTIKEIDLEAKYKILIRVSKVEKSRYDLISDFKKVISNKRKEEVIKKLELLSELKYKTGDYKASIRAIRRAEKYF